MKKVTVDEVMVTVDEVMAWRPCNLYTRERVTELFNDGDMLTAWDISVLDIPIADRIWALLHREFFTDSDLRLIACAFAERVIHIYERKYPGDYRPREVIRVARLFAVGRATLKDLKTVEAAAWAAVWAARAAEAAEAAARAAAWAAARAAAEAAVWAAVWAAARVAAEASAEAAAVAAAVAANWAVCDTTEATLLVARKAEYRAQLDIIKLYLEGQDEK
jgi:hypothetical protein